MTHTQAGPMFDSKLQAVQEVLDWYVLGVLKDCKVRQKALEALVLDYADVPLNSILLGINQGAKLFAHKSK